MYHSIHPGDGRLACFYTLAIISNAALNIRVYVLCGHDLGCTRTTGGTVHLLTLSSVTRGTATPFPTAAAPVCMPLSTLQASECSTSLPTLGVVRPSLSWTLWRVRSGVFWLRLSACS